MSKKPKQTETLCRDCDRSVGLCAWSAHLKPVKGWTARRVKYNGNHYRTTYCVSACPLFERTPPREPKRIDISLGGVSNKQYKAMTVEQRAEVDKALLEEG